MTSRVVALQLTHKDTAVTTFTDSAIGLSVFDVVVGKIAFLDNQEMQLKLSLQDYSDVMS